MLVLFNLLMMTSGLGLWDFCLFLCSAAAFPVSVWRLCLWQEQLCLRRFL